MFAAFRSCTQFRTFASYLHRRHIFQHNRKTVYSLDNPFCQFLHFRSGKNATDDIFIVIFIQDAAICIAVHITADRQDFIQPYSIMFHTGGVKQYLIFLDVTTNHSDLCHTTCRQQTRTDCPVGNRTQIEQRSRIGSQTDNHHFSQDRRLRSQRRLANILGKAFTNDCQLFRNNLAGTVDIRSPVKFNPYNRETSGRGRTYTAHIHSPVHCCFYRESHQAFHFFRSHTICFRHDNHGRSIQVGKHIYICMKSCIGSRYHQQQCTDQDNQSVMQRVIYYFIQHKNNCLISRICQCANQDSAMRFPLAHWHICIFAHY